MWACQLFGWHIRLVEAGPLFAETGYGAFVDVAHDRACA
jgi:hypothetical protein